MNHATPPSSAQAIDLRRELSERIERGTLELPVLSQVATRIATLCQESGSDARQLAETLNRDPALAGHVLRVANSSAYAPVEPIVSLQQAISRMGLATLGQIAFGIAAGARVFRVPGHEAWVAEMWRHATLSAGWGREIARARRKSGESAFLAGLLHDVGEPVLLQAAVDALGPTAPRAERAVLEPVLHELHGRAGACLVRAWKMPEWVADALLHHHDASACTADADTAHTTQLADELAHWVAERAQEPADAMIARLLGSPLPDALSLYQDELEALLARRDKVLDFAGAMQ